MVLEEGLDLPDFEDLKMEEVRLTQAHLMAAAPYVGKACEHVFNEFMYCRQNVDARQCVELGREVTECALGFFQTLKTNCSAEHNQYAECIDKSSGRFEPWHCRKTHELYKSCIDTCLDIQYPGFGYFARAKIHKSKIMKPFPYCPCDSFGEEPKQLPPEREFPRTEPRFGGRLYWTSNE